MKKVWSSIKGWFAYRGDGVIALIIVYTLLVFATIFCAWLLSGCNTSKEIQRTSVDSTGTSKADSGHVSKKTIESNTEWEWWKNTIVFDTNTGKLILPPKDSIKWGDPVVLPNTEYHYQPAFTMPQPKVIIMEGGKGRNETREMNYDSLWMVRFNLFAYHVEQELKKKDTKVLTIWHIVVGGIGAYLLTALIAKLIKALNKYKLVKLKS